MRVISLAAAAWILCLALLGADDRPTKAPPPSAEELDRLILQLGDDEPDKRKAAAAKLEAVGEPAAASLNKAADSADDPEVRKAAKLLLEKLAARAQGLLHDFRGSNPSIHAIAISADGKRGVSAHQDGCLRIWDLEQFVLFRQIAGHTGPVNCVAMSADGRRVLSCGSDRTMKLWDVATGAEVRNYAEHSFAVGDVAFSPDAQTILASCADGNIRCLGAASGRLLHTLPTGKEGGAWSVALTADGKTAITGGGAEGENFRLAPVRLWDLSTGKEVRKIADSGETRSRLAVSPDGKRLLAVGMDRMLLHWDLDTGRKLKAVEQISGITAAQFTPDGKRVVCVYQVFGGPAPAVPPALLGGGFVPAAPPIANAPFGLSLRDLATGKEIKRFDGHRNPVTCFAVSADGRRLLSGSSDGSMRLWELPK